MFPVGTTLTNCFPLGTPQQSEQRWYLVPPDPRNDSKLVKRTKDENPHNTATSPHADKQATKRTDERTNPQKGQWRLTIGQVLPVGDSRVQTSIVVFVRTVSTALQ